MTGEQSAGHFMFCSLDLKTACLTVYDTLSVTNLSEHPYISERALKKLGNSILISVTQHRRIKLLYKRTFFIQTGGVCGYLALLHCFLAVKFDYDAISNYEFKNFITDIELLKRFLVFQVIKKTLIIDRLTLS